MAVWASVALAASSAAQIEMRDRICFDSFMSFSFGFYLDRAWAGSENRQIAFPCQWRNPLKKFPGRILPPVACQASQSKAAEDNRTPKPVGIMRRGLARQRLGVQLSSAALDFAAFALAVSRCAQVRARSAARSRIRNSTLRRL